MRRLAHILLALAIFAGAPACDDSSNKLEADAEPWTYQSEQAPYSIEIPAQWQREDTREVNSYADFAIRLGERFFVIVIPQKLPSIPGIEPPDALALKRAGTHFFKKRVEDFSVEKQGPIDIAGETGISMFAEGKDNGSSIQYVIVFVTHDNWGYQIIAWSPKRHEDALITALDALLAGWSFESDEYDRPAAPKTPTEPDGLAAPGIEEKADDPEREDQQDQ
ncbi:MAG: hypothetical protein ACQEVA_06525 [Myxococcota bacterium]